MQIQSPMPTGGNNGQAGGQYKTIRVDLASLPDVLCEHCKGKIFGGQRFNLRLIPSGISASNRNELVILDLLYCVNCGRLSAWPQPYERQFGVDVGALPNEKCQQCNQAVFKQAWYWKKVSRIMSPDGQDRLMSVGPLYVCAGCGAPFDINASRAPRSAAVEGGDGNK